MVNRAGMWRFLEDVHLLWWIGGGIVSGIGFVWGLMTDRDALTLGASIGFAFCLVMLIGALLLAHLAKKRQPEKAEGAYTSGATAAAGVQSIPNADHRWSPYIPTWDDKEFREGGQEKRDLRTSRGLKPLSDFQEGKPASEVDPGTFAFVDSTYTIASDPLGIRATGQGFLEFHRLQNGTVEIIGFASKQDAHAVRSNTESQVSIFTRKTAVATELVAVAVGRIRGGECHSVKETAYRLDIRLKPLIQLTPP